MSRFADRMESFPHRDDPQCDCERCLETREPPRRVMCPNCKANGVVWEHIEGGFLEKCICSECEGTGYCEEA